MRALRAERTQAQGLCLRSIFQVRILGSVGITDRALLSSFGCRVGPVFGFSSFKAWSGIGDRGRSHHQAPLGRRPVSRPGPRGSGAPRSSC